MGKLILYGSGKIGKRWLDTLGDDKVYSFLDSNDENCGCVKYGKKVLSLAEVSLLDDVEIVVAVGKTLKEEVLQTLKSYNLVDKVVVNPYGESVVRWKDEKNICPTNVFEGHNFVADGTKLIESSLGIGSYIAYDSMIYKTIIGRFSSIGPRVKIIAGQHPTTTYVSTYPAFYNSDNQVSDLKFTDRQKFSEHRFCESGFWVEIGNDVWIGADVKIMEGVKIGDGAIIAAGAVVTKSIPSYSIFGGVPAKLIRMRFDERKIKFLEQLRWWNKGLTWIQNHAEYFDNIEVLMNAVKDE